MKKIAGIVMLLILVLSFTKDLYSQKPIKDTKQTVPQGYSPAQDSAFIKAARLRIPPEVRFVYDMELLNNSFRHKNQLKNKDVWMDAINDIHKRYPNLFQPSYIDVIHQEIARQNSMYVPYMTTLKATGIQIPLDAIGKLLGLIKDTSPVIQYELEFACEVEVVVYDMSGIVIAVLVEEKQRPGSYTFVWDFLDDQGLTVPPGDYIGEVRMGTSKYYRKQIEKK